ncbi:hypothetical protein M422DRAFT_241592 [Sphaerobolus stellatus SS14]|nr:hypothetical protein M422DRAFT_241592 [Sphaerobolus stellatus SS14]
MSTANAGDPEAVKASKDEGDMHKQPGQASSAPTANNNRTTGPPSAGQRQSFVQRAFSKQHKDTAKRFFSAYAQTWVGLMGEALTPGTKVGTQFRKGKDNLFNVGEEIRAVVSTSSQDIVIIIDEKLKSGKVDTIKTAEVLKAAGENAILVVSSSLEKAQGQLKELNAQFGPSIRKSVSQNGRDVIVVLDKTLKNPIVITGVSKFAQSKGIPHADALLRLASLGLAKILNALPEVHLEGAETIVEEIDAAELERTSSREDNENAAKIGREGDKNASEPKVADRETPQDKKESRCVIC